MAKLPSENTDAMKYFRSFLSSWIKKTGMNKTVAAKRLGVGQSQLNEILNAKRGASLYQMEKICNNIGVNIVSALERGRKLCGELSEDKKFSKDQIESIEAFKIVLLHGGEAAEILEQAIRELANKKQAEAEFKNPTTALKSKSA
ncbi:hypothetical protein C4J81_10345 [Deltaproteobacteria bacterium Smac51]|nr:hypothetical protein C4J81_10345 [Deltaproteobacteria bacterium Smac51]